MDGMDKVVVFIDTVDVFLDNLSASDFSTEESMVERFNCCFL